MKSRLERVVRQTLDDRFGSDADLAAAIVAAVLDELQLRQEWAMYTDRNTRGNPVEIQLQAESQEAAEEYAAKLVETFWRNHEGVSGAGLLEPKPEIRSRWLTPWQATR